MWPRKVLNSYVHLTCLPYVRVQPTRGGFMVLLPSGAGRSVEFTGIRSAYSTPGRDLECFVHRERVSVSMART